MQDLVQRGQTWLSSGMRGGTRQEAVAGRPLPGGAGALSASPQQGARRAQGGRTGSEGPLQAPGFSPGPPTAFLSCEQREGSPLQRRWTSEEVLGPSAEGTEGRGPGKGALPVAGRWGHPAGRSTVSSMPTHSSCSQRYDTAPVPHALGSWWAEAAR